LSNILYIGAAVSNEEKGQWVYLVVIVLTYVAYVAIVLSRAGQGALTDVDYVPVMLGAIGIGIALSVVGRIVVEIAGGGDSHDADVRDRDVGRFGEYFAGTLLGVAMVVPFVLALAEADWFWIANAMYLAFVTSAVVGAAVKLVAYRRGI
jgi:hypothetical protein